MDNSEIDLNEKGLFKVEDFFPNELFIGNGLILTIGYSSSIFEYNFENNKEYNTLLAEYEQIINEYINKSL